MAVLIEEMEGRAPPLPRQSKLFSYDHAIWIYAEATERFPPRLLS
jgi:hypothetical protein